MTCESVQRVQVFPNVVSVTEAQVLLPRDTVVHMGILTCPSYYSGSGRSWVVMWA
jgi:hypothetical protein